MKKEYRVKKSKEIERIIKHRKSVGNQHFVMYKLENHEISHFRYAISVSKKFGNAVKRNKIKRQIREIVAKSDFLDTYDIFIVVQNKSRDLSFNEIQSEISNLSKKLKITEVK